MGKDCCDFTSFSERCEKLIKADAGRMTEPRRLVISCLSEQKTPVSANEIFEMVTKSKSPSANNNIDKVTIYRILEKFTELGLLHRVGPAGKYIACVHEHIDNKAWHIISRCLKCETTNEVALSPKLSGELLLQLRQAKFTVSTTPIQVEGTCEVCLKKPSLRTMR